MAVKGNSILMGNKAHTLKKMGGGSFHGASKLNCVLIQYWGQFYTVYHDKDKKGYKKSKNHNGKIVNKKKKTWC